MSQAKRFRAGLLNGVAMWLEPEPLPAAFWDRLASIWAMYKTARGGVYPTP